MAFAVETPTSTFTSPQRQYFSLPSVFITYLLDNPKYPNDLLKLYRTCKYFYSKRQVSCILNDAEYGPDYVDIGSTTIPLKNLKASLWLDKYVIFRDVSKLANIYRSTLKELSLCNTTLLLSEFSKLVNENKIFHFYTDCQPARYVDDTAVSMDVILQMLPNLVRLYYYDKNEKYFSTTLEKCCQIKFWNKLYLCGLFLFSNDFDPKMLFKFVTYNPAPKMHVSLHIGPNVFVDKKAELKLLFDNVSFNMKISANW